MIPRGGMSPPCVASNISVHLQPRIFWLLARIGNRAYPSSDSSLIAGIQDQRLWPEFTLTTALRRSLVLRALSFSSYATISKWEWQNENSKNRWNGAIHCLGDLFASST